MNPEKYIEALSHEKTVATGIAFPKEEYFNRIRKVQNAMEERGLNLLLVSNPNNCYYLTGYYSFGVGNQVIFTLPLSGDPSLIVTSIEIPAAIVNSWVQDVSSVSWQSQHRSGEQVIEVIKRKGFAEKVIGVEASIPGLLASTYQELRQSLPKAEFRNASDLIASIKVVKSTLELECLRKAAKYTLTGIEASLSVISAGVTDNDIAKTGYEAMIGAGSEFMSVQPVVAVGIRSSFTHQTYRRITADVSDTIYLEYGGCHQRYTSPMMRSAFIGKPSDEVLRLSDAVEATLETVLENARPGVSCHDVAVAAKKAHATVTDEIYFLSTYGYSVGASFPPTWAESFQLMEGNELPLLPGMAFHVAIMFRKPGKFGVGISETIIITEKGNEVITAQERSLVVIQ